MHWKSGDWFGFRSVQGVLYTELGVVYFDLHAVNSIIFLIYYSVV